MERMDKYGYEKRCLYVEQCALTNSFSFSAGCDPVVRRRVKTKHFMSDCVDIDKKTVTIPYDVFYFRLYFCCLAVVEIGFM